MTTRNPGPDSRLPGKLNKRYAENEAMIGRQPVSFMIILHAVDSHGSSQTTISFAPRPDRQTTPQCDVLTKSLNFTGIDPSTFRRWRYLLTLADCGRFAC